MICGNHSQPTEIIHLVWRPVQVSSAVEEVA